MDRPNLKNFTQQQVIDFAVSLGMSAYRGRQIFSWLYRPGIIDFSQMTDLSKKDRALLSEKASFSTLRPEVVERSADGTIKYGYRLTDEAFIESVLIPEDGRNTLCVSSQVGCGMKCRFCLTGSMGFKRNLEPSEMVNQVMAVWEMLAEADPNTPETDLRRINNLVFMGMGEPLANLDNLITALTILTDQRGLDFSDRRITVSTCGLVPQIRELGEKTNVNLAISLHAVDDAVRTSLMPVNARYSLEEVLQACREFPLAKRRRIMFEYILIRDLNDSLDQARRLAKMLRDIRCKINLLPCNEAPGLPFMRTTEERVREFQKVLLDAGYTVIVRSSRGDDISAACGQLAGKCNSNS